MSTIKHRQPIVNWSSVVLLSALLWSPMTAASVLHVLSQAFPHAFAAASEDSEMPVRPVGPDGVALGPAAPYGLRRTNNEREALRRAISRVSRLHCAVRIDTDAPGFLHGLVAGATVTTLVPTDTAAQVSDTTVRSVSGWPGVADATAASRTSGNTPPRAPPVA